MSTSKYLDRICILAVVAAMLVSILFMNGAALGIQVRDRTMGYEEKLFDTTMVHTIDILIDDWDAFLSTAQSEEYSVCNVVIDGEAFSNVGIRGKGNTSLSTVSSMDSDRYSFKIEFDQYDSTKSYYGLDKLSLNNLIQDNTMMKDYLTYQMMNEFGVAAPLSSYVYITVNGEDWGLYLAVEAVEESFLQRNYGSDYGELYKPDSMNMGGGRGNGKDFDFADFSGEEGFTFEGAAETMPEGFGSGRGGMRGGSTEGESATMPEGFDPGQMGGTMPGGAEGETATMPEGFDPGQMGGTMPGGAEGETATMPGGFDRGQMGGNMGGGMSMGSSETKLQYIDDDASSYSTIFSSAKTDVTTADQERLIEALKTLSQGEDVSSAVAVEDVIRYFVVHNYVVNGDSYTGSMVHNYYLYEEDGRLSMIPWDYNLAFGTFQGGSAAGSVSDDIDAPLSVTGFDRPMIDWIFGSEEYTELYHACFQEFLDTVDVNAIIEQAEALIAPYVEKDPTKFCTYAEFETGVQTLKAFCELRSQSVAAQLAGEDGTVDASGITLSDMGTMNNGMGGGRGEMTGGMQMPGQQGTAGDTTGTEESTGGVPQFPGMGGMQMPGQTGTAGDAAGTDETTGSDQMIPGMGGQTGMQFPEGMELPEGMENMQFGDLQNRGQTGTGTAQGGNAWIVLGISALILAAGLLFAFKFKR